MYHMKEIERNIQDTGVIPLEVPSGEKRMLSGRWSIMILSTGCPLHGWSVAGLLLRRHSVKKGHRQHQVLKVQNNSYVFKV